MQLSCESQILRFSKNPLLLTLGRNVTTSPTVAWNGCKNLILHIPLVDEVRPPTQRPFFETGPYLNVALQQQTFNLIERMGTPLNLNSSVKSYYKVEVIEVIEVLVEKEVVIP